MIPLITLKRSPYLLDNIREAAAVAYSIRKLTSKYPGACLRLRRSSDNLETDIGFTSQGLIDTNAILSHCLTFARPLDAISVSAAAAYSLRRIRTAYNGFAVRVRRSSDNAELDIPFTASGDLDTFALLSHCSARSGFVTTWYDQSGNGRNATQATAANQPRIVNAGVIDLFGSRPTVLGLGGSTKLSATLTASTTDLSSVVALSGSTGTFPVAYCLRPTGSASDTSAFSMLQSSASNIYSPPTSTYASVAAGTGTPSIISVVKSSSIKSIRLNNATAVTENSAAAIGSITVNQLDLFGTTGFGGGSWASPIAEAIFFTSTLSDSDRFILEQSQSAYYGITITGGVSGFVTTWYDQSLNRNNLIQATAANQPRIVNNGVLELNSSGTPALYSHNINCNLTAAPPFPDTSEFSMHFCWQNNVFNNWGGSGSSSFRLDTNGFVHSHTPWGDGRIYFDVGAGAAPNRIVSNVGVLTAGSNAVLTLRNSVSAAYQQARVNGTTVASDNDGHNVTCNFFWLFASGIAPNAHCSEWIIMRTESPTTLRFIEQNQGTFQKIGVL